jgi:hypothetical protein
MQKQRFSIMYMYQGVSLSQTQRSLFILIHFANMFPVDNQPWSPHYVCEASLKDILSLSKMPLIFVPVILIFLS